MLSGAFTAIVTPFAENGEVDYNKLRELIAIQGEAGIDGIVPVGTTGESPTLTVEEHLEVINVTVDACRGSMKVIAGSGSNSTAEAIAFTRHARDAGADATLQITPYYNKPSQQGLIEHFTAVADLGLPVVLYNVPGRTSREIEVETVIELSRHEHVAALKEAGGSVDRVSTILDGCDIVVLSGDDALTLPMMSVGAAGVISVASNVIPGGVAGMVNAVLAGRWEEARELHRKYHEIFNGLFLDTNPIPVKAALAMMGRLEERYRLPLCPMSDSLKNRLRGMLSELELV